MDSITASNDAAPRAPAALQNSDFDVLICAEGIRRNIHDEQIDLDTNSR